MSTSSDPPNTRSIKIAHDERGGWSSDRPRRDGAPPRPADVAVRGRVLTPSDRLRYSPGSVVLITGPSPADRERFVERLIDNKASVLSLAKVRQLLDGRVPSEQIAGRAGDVLDAAVLKRLDANQTIVIAAETLSPEEREHFVRMAARFKRPCHLILLDSGRDQTADDDRSALNELRRRLNAGELASEGFQTAVRLGGESIGELKRIVFGSQSRDD